MNISDQLEGDLRSLANEAKNKSPALKEQIERAIGQLRSNAAPPVTLILASIEQAQTINFAKLQLQCLVLIQRLISGNTLDGPSLIKALQLMQNLLKGAEESVQLKSIQTLMQVLNPEHIQLSKALVEAIWGLLMELEGSRSSLSRNTAIAALQQLVNVCFDALVQTMTEAIYDSCHFVLRSVVELAGGQHTLWKSDQLRQRVQGVQLLESILRSSRSALSQHQELLDLLQVVSEKVLPNYIVEDIGETLGHQSIQCAVHIVEMTNKSPKLIEAISLLSANRRTPLWQQVACLEGLSSVCSNPQTVWVLYENNQVQGLLNSLNILSHECFSRTEEANEAGSGKLVGLSAEIVNKVVDSFGSLVEKEGLELGEMAQFPLTEACTQIEQTLLELWRFLLPVLSIIATHCWKESVLQTVLNGYQAMVNISGTLNCSVVREGFLASLAQLCLPPKGSSLTSKNVYACKTMFNITHCLGRILDVKAWHRVLDVLYHLDYHLHTSGKKDEKIESDMQILNSALESLFTNTQSWPDNTLLDLLSALGQLTLEFMESLATNEQKLSGMKAFGLEKMTILAQTNLPRATLYWEMLAAYLDCICNSKYPEIRVLGISSLSRVLIKVFKYFVDNPPEPTSEKWKGWQRTLFLSLHDLSGSGYVGTQEAVFQSILSILQSCGGQLDKGGWSMLLFILCKIDPASQTNVGFKCLQLIVSDFLQSENLLPSIDRLINCISKYAYQLNDINQAISAVGMYWNVADYVGRVGKEEEQFWWLILGELKILGEDPRPEVRHSAIQSLHVALTTHGSCLSSESWQKLMKELILNLLLKISDSYFQHATVTQEVPLLEPPKFVGAEEEQPAAKPGRRNLQISIPTDLAHPLVAETPKFAGRSEEKLVVHHSRDTVEKQWEETYHIFTQNLGKIFRTYLVNVESSEDTQDSEQKLKSNWDILMLRLKQGLHNGTTNIILAVLKASIELLNSEQVRNLFFSNWGASWELFTTLSNRLQVSQITIPSKLVTTVLENLSLIIASGRPEPFRERHLNEMFVLLNCLIENSKHESTLSNCKLLLEQKEVFDFIEKLGGSLKTNQIDMKPYLHFILKYCKYDAQDSHSDAITRRGLTSIHNFLANDPEAVPLISADVLATYRRLLLLRFDNEAVMLMNVTRKGAPPLWVFATETFLNLMSLLMQLPDWSGMIEILRELLTSANVTQLNPSNLEQLGQLGEPADMKLVEFVVQNLIPQSMQRDEDTQWSLITLLDQCCDNYYRAFHAEELSYENSLSSTSIAGLFALSKASGKDLTQRILPVLIERCKVLLTKFATEEKLMGQMPLPKGRLLEILEILNWLKDLEIPPDVLQRPGPKAHLIELFPQLCELISAKEYELKEKLKEVFLEITKVF